MNKIKRFSLLFVLVTTIQLSLLAQDLSQPSFQTYDAETFGVKSIHAALYSSKGYGLWIATEKGLGLYNGYKTKLFPKSENKSKGPLSTRMMEFFEDRAGLLWFGYGDETAVSSFDPKKQIFKHYEFDSLNKNSFPETVVSRFFENKNGELWVSTWGGGIFIIDKTRKNTKKITIEDFPNMKSDAVRDMIELEPGKILISYFEEYINNYPSIYDESKQTFTDFPIEHYKGNRNDAAYGEIKNMLSISHFLYKDKYDKLWIGTYSGLAYIDLKNKTFKRISGKKFDENIVTNLENCQNFIEADSNHLWVTTANSGIMIVDLTTNTARYNLKNNNNCPNCISDKSINNFSKDKDGNIWIVSGSRGLTVYSPFKQHFKIKDWKSLGCEYHNSSHQNMPLSSMFIRNNKHIYISNFYGIAEYDYFKDSVYENIKPYSQYSVRGSTNQDLWNFRLINGKIHFVSNAIEAEKFFEYDLISKKSKKMNYKNLFDKRILFPQDSISSSSYIRSANSEKLYEIDKNGKLDSLNYKFKKNQIPNSNFSEVLSNGKWFISGGEYSFMIFDPIKKINTYYSSRKSECDVYFGDSAIYSYYYNKKNTVWIATVNGLHSLDIVSGKTKSWNKEMGIDNFLITGVIEDKNGEIWFTSNREIFHYLPDVKKLIRYGREVGITHMEFDHKKDISQMVTDGENVFFPTANGLLFFNIYEVSFPKTKPILSISSMDVNDSLIEYLGETKLSNLKFNYSQNNLLFEFQTSQIYTPYPNKFKYQLLGQSEKWIDNESSNKIKLQNLSPGDYTLIVYTINCYNVESDEYKLNFTINKPFWNTWWFYSLCIATLGCTVFFYIRIREKKLNERQLILEKTVEERTAEISVQKDLIEEKHQEITDSINYAERIQRSFLATKDVLDENLKDYFIFFQPKAIVSGDFYWANKLSNGNFLLATADSTGHGVPGAIMSLLNITSLESATKDGLIEPSDILNATRQTIIERLKKDGSTDGGKDGMDCSLISFDFKNNKLTYSAANNPVWIIRDHTLIVLAHDKMPVSKHDRDIIPFCQHEFILQKGDVVYTITDGMSDQFGGPKGKKFMHKQLKELLISISNEPMEKQKQILADKLNNWKGDLEQVDDVCVIGLRI